MDRKSIKKKYRLSDHKIKRKASTKIIKVEKKAKHHLQPPIEVIYLSKLADVCKKLFHDLDMENGK